MKQPNITMNNGQFQTMQHPPQSNPRSEKLQKQFGDILISLNNLIEANNKTKDQEYIEKCNKEIKNSLIQFDCEIDRNVMEFSKLFLQHCIGDKNRSTTVEPETYLKELASQIDRIELD